MLRGKIRQTNCSVPDGMGCRSPFCVDTTTDARNCGFCGNACPAGRICVAGDCRDPG